MRRWRWKALLVLSGIVLLFAIYWPQSEPAYRGKPLSFWLQGFESDKMEARWQSAESVRYMGTNALPSLITQLRQPPIRNEQKWRQWLRAFLSKQSLIKVNIPRPPDRRAEALAALDALGPLAKDAVPALEELLHEAPPDHRALIILAGIGTKAIPALTSALTNNEKVIRLGARVCLNMQKTHSEFLSPRTAEDAEFMRRNCEFKASILRAASEVYRAQHPEEFSADGMPRPSLPPGYTPLLSPETNGEKVALPITPPG